MSCENCKLESRMESVESSIRQIKEEHIGQLLKTNEISVTFEYIKEKLEKLEAKIDKITEAPANRWNTVISTIISGITAAIVAAIMLSILK